jgi:uncharacterized membrane protein
VFALRFHCRDAEDAEKISLRTSALRDQKDDPTCSRLNRFSASRINRTVFSKSARLRRLAGLWM